MKQKHSVSVVCYTIAGLAALITIFPLYWTLITSFKTYKEAFAQPPDFFTAVSLDNYIAFLKQNNVLLYLKNSIIISVFSVLIPLILGLFASYVITRSSIPGKEGFSMFLIASRFIPPASTLIPTYLHGWTEHPEFAPSFPSCCRFANPELPPQPFFHFVSLGMNSCMP